MPEVESIDVTISVSAGSGSAQKTFKGEVREWCVIPPAPKTGLYDFEAVEGQFGRFGETHLTDSQTRGVKSQCLTTITLAITNAVDQGDYLVRLYGFFKGYSG